MAPAQSEIAQTVERFIRGHFRVLGADRSFHRDAHLYEGGFVDSVGVIELIAFVESRFNVELEDEDVFSDGFTTINGISGLIFARLRDNGSGRADMDEPRELSGTRG